MKTDDSLAHFWASCVFVVAASLSASSWSAQYSTSQYQSLLDIAKRDGYVRVMIGLGSYSIFSVARDVEGASREMAEKSALMMAELGENVLIGGFDYSHFGYMHAYVNETGLRILSESTLPRSLSDGRHYRTITVQESDGSLDAVLQAFRSNSLVEVDLFLNLAVNYSLARSGETVYHSTPELHAEVQRSIDSLRQQPYAKAIEILAVDASRPVVRARIDRSAFYGLIEDKGLRAVRLPGHLDVRAVQWSEEALAKAEVEGKLQVDLSLRGGDLYASGTDNLSNAARGYQSAAHRAAFADIFQQAGVVVDMDGLGQQYAVFDAAMRQGAANFRAVTRGNSQPAVMDEDIPDLYLLNGSMSLTLTGEELAKLYSARDARVLSVTPPYSISITTAAFESIDTREMEIEISEFPLAPSSPTIHDMGDASLQFVMGEQAPLPDSLEYCFPQLSLIHSSQGPVLEYKQIIAESDLGQTGFVFVAARNKREPDLWWLLSPGGEWVEFGGSGVVAPVYHRYFRETDVISSTYISLGTHAVPDVEIWVGYGSGAEQTAAFDDMIDRDQFKQIWKSTPTGSSAGASLVNSRICIAPSKVSVQSMDEAIIITGRFIPAK